MAYSEKLAEKVLDASVSSAIDWDREQVGEWITSLGFPQYQDCFVANYISGRKLIFIHQSSLPLIGITDFVHAKAISAAVRDLLKIEKPDYHRSISLPDREKMAAFLLEKSVIGRRSDALTYVKFLKRNRHIYSMK